jgi:hypothetical protein
MRSADYGHCLFEGGKGYRSVGDVELYTSHSRENTSDCGDESFRVSRQRNPLPDMVVGEVDEGNSTAGKKIPSEFSI